MSAHMLVCYSAGVLANKWLIKITFFWEGGSEDREISCVALGSHRAEDDLSQF